MQRRQFLGFISLLALPFHALNAKTRPTPADVEGPFYPVKPIPLDSNLLNGNALSNAAMEISGRILDKQGKPLSNAKIEIWQCDSNGIYDHPQQHQTDRFDQNFRGFGAQLSNAQGYYAFTTIFPAPYTGRPPHIHVKIWHKDNELLTTQLYLQGNTGSSWYIALREPLQINPKKDANGNMKAIYTFVV